MLCCVVSCRVPVCCVPVCCVPVCCVLCACVLCVVCLCVVCCVLCVKAYGARCKARGLRLIGVLDLVLGGGHRPL